VVFGRDRSSLREVVLHRAISIAIGVLTLSSLREIERRKFEWVVVVEQDPGRWIHRDPVETQRRVVGCIRQLACAVRSG
jgi:hypothetical protein